MSLLLKLSGTYSYKKRRLNKPKLLLNHDTIQVIEQQEEPEIYREKKMKLSPLQAQVHSAVKRAQDTTIKHTRRQQVPQTNSSGQKRPTELTRPASLNHQSSIYQKAKTQYIRKYQIRNIKFSQGISIKSAHYIIKKLFILLHFNGRFQTAADSVRESGFLVIYKCRIIKVLLHSDACSC